ncbi:histidine kinase [Pseudanabaena sp. FACHB-2040]|uniref:histidine kinase n=1 Tax=Pseudanabaena sp. FACHB-2040 TaxID=2692859 RepID=UPI0016840908|nr:histidine kinase [Pseudanabaena sp. FACHB-2040]MBD2259628.1 histidine kinase [Pseudanabaena sp. FACHB-2040]
MEDSVNGIRQDIQLPLKLLLFIDKRPGSAEHVQQIRHYMRGLEEHFSFHLDVVDVGEQPYLAEHYKLVASPALIKLSPSPQQTLAGRDIIPQLEMWWPRWYREATDGVHTSVKKGSQADLSLDLEEFNNEISHSAEIMKLSDEIFRLNQTKEELEAQLRFKNRIIAMLAHDLRNPLTAASIAVETLEMGHVPRGERSINLSPALTAQLLKHARTQIRAIDRMITDILNAARGASVDLQLQPQEMNLKDLCLEVVDSFQRRFADKQQQVVTDIPQDLPTVYADSVQVRRVVVNLLDNAVKYTPEGGRIEVLALHRTTQKVQITINDTGPGIPPENQDKIFEERYRLQRDENKEGYGLGLALCQRIIRAHYGQIWVDSKPESGSCFYFTLPVYGN